MSQSATEIMRHIVKHELPLMRMLTIMPVEAEKQCSERRLKQYGVGFGGFGGACWGVD